MKILNFCVQPSLACEDINGSLNVLIEQIGEMQAGLCHGVLSTGKNSEMGDELLEPGWQPGGTTGIPTIGYSVREAGNRAFCLDANGRYDNGGSPAGAERSNSWNFHQKLANVKFRFSSNRSGCLCVGSSSAEGFSKGSRDAPVNSRGWLLYFSLRSRQSDDQAEIRHLQRIRGYADGTV